MRHHAPSILGLSILAAALLAAPARAAAYANCVVIDCANAYILRWNVTGDTLFASMEANTMGWVALGLSFAGMRSQGDPANAPTDIIAGWAHPGPIAPAVMDYSARSYAPPPLDASQDVTLISATFIGGTTRIEWSRALNTGDAADRPFTPGTPQTVVWATSPAAGAVSAAFGLSSHLVNTRGSISIDFGEAAACAADACGAPPPSRYATQLASCISNGWTPAEASGDVRDDGAAHPRVLQNVTRNVTRLVELPVPTASGTPSALPTVSSTPTSSITRTSLLSASTGAAPSTSSTPDATPTTSPTSPASPSPSSSAPPSLASMGDALDRASSPLLSSPNGVLTANWVTSASASTPMSTAGAPGGAMVVRLSSSQRGWFALGFNPSAPTMGGADMVVAWVAPVAAGEVSCVGLDACAVYLSDSVSDRFSAPVSDVSRGGANHLLLLNASITADGVTTVTFARPLATLDPSDADLSVGSPAVFILWAYGTSNGDAATGAFSQHGADARGASVGTVAFAAVGAAQLDALAPPSSDDSSGSGVTPPVVAPILTAVTFIPLVGGAFTLHAVAMILGFWFFMLTGVWAARFRSGLMRPCSSGTGGGSRGRRPASSSSLSKPPAGTSNFHSKQTWFVLHVYSHVATAVCLLIGTVAILTAKAATGGAGRVALWDSHQAAGVTALVAFLAQVAVGVARPDVGAGRKRALWLVAQ